MEDSKKGKKDDEKELSTPSPHMDDKKVKKPWYIRGRKEKGRGR